MTEKVQLEISVFLSIKEEEKKRKIVLVFMFDQ
jgi:hypothetical protein